MPDLARGTALLGIALANLVGWLHGSAWTALLKQHRPDLEADGEMQGDTALSDGTRVPKHDPRVEAYGTVDELNATLGLARLHAEGPMAAQIGVIQNELFDLGADLSTPLQADPEYPPLRVKQEWVDELEADCDDYLARLEPLRSFILSGGTPGAAHLHVGADQRDPVLRSPARGPGLAGRDADRPPDRDRARHRWLGLPPAEAVVRGQAPGARLTAWGSSP